MKPVEAKMTWTYSSVESAWEGIIKLVKEDVLEAKDAEKAIQFIIDQRGPHAIEIEIDEGQFKAFGNPSSVWTIVLKWPVLVTDIRPVNQKRPVQLPMWARVAGRLIPPQHREELIGDLLERRAKLAAAGVSDRVVRWRLIYPDLAWCGVQRLLHFALKFCLWVAAIAGAEAVKEWVKGAMGKP